jgi:hypothetical protein
MLEFLELLLLLVNVLEPAEIPENVPWLLLSEPLYSESSM